MNIYVDIDGVLLANEENLAIGAAEFTALCKYALYLRSFSFIAAPPRGSLLLRSNSIHTVSDL